MNRERDAVIRTFLQQYRKSLIQSEAEIRSKFVVPLLELLGYPSELRAEEFPVYGYGGRERLPAKNADFILFDERDFRDHRTKTQANRDWVCRHSLLVVEAKKPGEIPEDSDLGQAQFYAVWTRAVGYIVTDGEILFCRIYNCVADDYEILNLRTDDMVNHDGLWVLSYENILSIKHKSISTGVALIAKQSDRGGSTDHNDYSIEAALSALPNSTIAYLQHALGRNADGLDKAQLASRFLNLTNVILRNDLRFDIPPYILDFPRHEYKAKLCINNELFPMMVGTVIEFYWDEIERYFFDSRYLKAMIVLRQNQLVSFEIGFSILDRHVADRISGFLQVEKCLTADTIRILVENPARTNLVLPARNPGNMWISKTQVTQMGNYWLKGLYKLRAIEEYYEIEFCLKDFIVGEELNRLLDSIELVFAGTCLQKNCDISLPGYASDSDVIVEEPVPFQTNEEISLPDRIIHDVVFRPYICTLLPSKLAFSGKPKGDIVLAPASCEYRIVNEVEASNGKRN